MKKTTTKKTAKKATTKQAKAFAEALSTFKTPEPFQYPEHEEREKTFATVAPLPVEAFMEEGDVQFDDQGNVMGPIGDMRAVNLGGDTISLEEADRHAGIELDWLSLPQEIAQEASQAPSGHIVPQAHQNAPQKPLHSEELGQTPEPEKPTHHISNEQIANCIEGLNDGLIFLSRKGYLKKLQEKDLAILQARINVGKTLIAHLCA